MARNNTFLLAITYGNHEKFKEDESVSVFVLHNYKLIRAC
jgi:hypothetical protein